MWLFDAHAGGVPLSHSLRYVITPLLFELAVILPALFVLPAWLAGGWASRDPNLPSFRFRGLGVGAVFLSALFLAGIPSLVVIRGMASGFESLYTNWPMVRQIGSGAVIALGAALIACGLSRFALASASTSRKRRWIAAALGLPGLLGSLVLSLMILGMFQLPGLRVLSQSLIPLILALSLFVLPRTLVVFAVIGSTRRTEAVQCAASLVAISAGGEPIGGGETDR